MNATQARIAAKMLEIAADEFANHSCNDFELDYTPENLEFATGLVMDLGYSRKDISIDYDARKIWIPDTNVMVYCAKLLREEA